MVTKFRRATEGLRDEHAGLRHGASALAKLASELTDWSGARVAERLTDVRRFCVEEMGGHPDAEEAILYPLVDKVIAPGATDTMIADHEEIRRRSIGLSELAGKIGAGPPSPGQLEALREHLYGLWAIVCLHLDKEEKVLFPLLDDHLSAADIRTLQQELAAFGAGRLATSAG